MYKNQRIIALVPARGGSKGLPHKNIRLLEGKPLIAWTIEQAKKSKYIDRVIVSTDDKKIANISKQYQAQVPFLRPAALATDKAAMMDVVFHAMEWIKRNNDSYDLIMLLQPTSPLRKSRDIDDAIKWLFKKNAKAIVSVCKTEHHPYGANVLPKNGCMGTFIRPEIVNKNRQQLPVFYRINGAIYLANWSYLKKNRQFLGKKTYAYIMPAVRSVDIDSHMDFEFAGFCLKTQRVRQRSKR
ncbi:MAG: acylneuraminate cytidylyltransferase family protein [Candidatus Omnitrophica bacterium]|nr:acylneuraminate cytidylyltransferase family protein [Candidatus Omnitrophota bacterium]